MVFKNSIGSACDKYENKNGCQRYKPGIFKEGWQKEIKYYNKPEHQDKSDKKICKLNFLIVIRRIFDFCDQRPNAGQYTKNNKQSKKRDTKTRNRLDDITGGDYDEPCKN